MLHAGAAPTPRQKPAVPLIANPHVAIVGGGPAGLMAADVVSAAGVRVTVYDRMPTLGRKFLMAGRGGLNLTHTEPFGAFLPRYREGEAQLRAAIEAFPPEAVRAWCEALGQSTFVGSSGRVFPQAMKTSPLLRAWLRQLSGRGVTVRPRHTWKGWDDDGRLLFDSAEGQVAVEADAVVFALGGGSWPGLGSDAGWVGAFQAAGIAVAPIAPTNCGFIVAWSQHFKNRFQGQPLKRIGLAHAGQQVRGEAVVTEQGLEGGAIYALSAALRDRIARDGEAELLVDLRPDLNTEVLARQLDAPRGKASLSTVLRRVRLSPVSIGLLQEWTHRTGVRIGRMDAAALAERIKGLPVVLVGTAPIERAISTAGGVRLDAVDADYMLTSRAGTFVAGEMLDWEAPTGGYLLQACLSTAAAAGRGVLAWLSAGSRPGSTDV